MFTRLGASHRLYTKFSKDIHASFRLDGAAETLHVTSLTSQGHLVLSNGQHLTRSVVLFPSFALDWKVDLNDIENAEAYMLAQVLQPKPEIVLIGTGHQSLVMLPSLRAYFSSLKIPCEIMDTVAFNFIYESAV